MPKNDVSRRHNIELVSQLLTGEYKIWLGTILTEETQTSKILTHNFVTVPRKAPEGPLNIVGLTRSSLRKARIESGTPEKQANMRVGQIWQWIYEKGERDFSNMTNLAKPYRMSLQENFVISVPQIISKNISQDGTRKYLLRIDGGH